MSLRDIAAAAGVKHAHIVDDAFDTIPGAGLADGAISTFLSSIDETQFNRMLEILGIPDGNEDLATARLRTADGAATLFGSKVEFGEFANLLFESFLAATQPEQDRLKPLLDYLAAEGIGISKFGRAYDAGAEPAPELLFVDLKLNENAIVLEEPIRVVQKAREMYPGTHPMVFLISAQDQTLDARRVEFRDRCTLFASQFECLSKGAIRDKRMLEQFLEHHIEAFPHVTRLGKHAKAWESAIESAKTTFLAGMRRMDIPDYFTLHNSAKADDVTLGTYVSELLLGYVANEIEGSSAVAEFAKDLDGWTLESVTRSRFSIEPTVAEIFSANVIFPPARLAADVSRGLGPPNGYLTFGDIYVPRSEAIGGKPKLAIAIITPDCDLVRPASLQSRKASVLLCEGVVEPFKPTTTLLGQSLGLDKVLLKIPADGPTYAIDWYKKRLSTWSYDKIDEMVKGSNSAWIQVGRLRVAYALQLQQAVLSDLGRVGTARTPVLYVPHGLMVCVPKGGKWIALTNSYSNDPSAGAVAIDRSIHKRHFVVSDMAIRHIMQELRKWLSKNAGEPAAALLTSLQMSDEAVRALMFPTIDVEGLSKASAPMFPLHSVAGLETSVVFAIQRDEDQLLNANREWNQTMGAVLLLRFVRLT